MRLETTLFFLLSALMIAGPAVRADVDVPNPGPRSMEEAGFLFKEGQHAFSIRDFRQTIRSLSRMIERYPGDSRTDEAYLTLLNALDRESLSEEVLRYGQQLILRRPGEALANEARLLMAGAELGLRRFLTARTLATELLQNKPTAKQAGLAHAIRFEAHLEDKQYDSAETELNTLRDFLEREPDESLKRRIPALRMMLQTRKCMVTHLLKDTPAGDDELLEYFSKKNLCYKGAVPGSASVREAPVIADWCESFTFFNHELQKMGMDAFLKEKIKKDLDTTFDLAKGMNPELVKCYAPYQPPKSKKRHRRRNHKKP